MFRLFGKKEEKFVAPEMKVQVLILSLMNTYLERCKGDIVLVKEEPDLKREYERLESLELSNTENAKLLKAKLKEVELKKERSKFGKGVMDWIVGMKDIFPNSYLVSFDQFKKILKDYGLVTNFLKNYVGIIPSKNITEIENVKEAMTGNNTNILWYLNKFDKKEDYNHCNFHYIDGVMYRGEGGKKDCKRIQEVVEKIGSIISIRSCYSCGERSIGLHHVEEITRELPKGLKSGPFSDFTLTLEKMDATELMIAAPRNCFSSEFKISEMPVDPIVFQCCPYGVIVHSVWGEEADDKVLEEYKMLNQKILSM